MSKYNFKHLIPWSMLKQHLERQKQMVITQIYTAKGEQELYNLQGQGQVIEQLLNLPEILEALANFDEEEANRG